MAIYYIFNARNHLIGTSYIIAIAIASYVCHNYKFVTSMVFQNLANRLKISNCLHDRVIKLYNYS